MNLEIKMKQFRTLGMFFAFLVLSFWGNAQDCTLDIGGKNTDILIRIFQLNEEQISQMEVWRAELEIETKVVEDDIQKLFDNQPQSTPAELTTLADKYKVLQQKIVDASMATDKMLLSVFNEKQYDRYLNLCDEAYRRPIKIVPITPVVQKDSVADPE